MPNGLKNSGLTTLSFNLAKELLLISVASSSFFSISCFLTKPSSSSVASWECPRSHRNESFASLNRCCVSSHEGDSGMNERMIIIKTGKTPAMKETTFQCRNVPNTWQSRMPNEMERVIEASRKPLNFGSLWTKKENMKHEKYCYSEFKVLKGRRTKMYVNIFSIDPIHQKLFRKSSQCFFVIYT